MTVTVLPGRASGTVTAPPSKSIAHRLLICAGLSQGESLLTNVSDSDDMKATISCLEALGATFTREENGLRVRGIDPLRATPKNPLFCNESGSTLRFLLPVALLCGKETVLSGKEVLFRRPLSVYESLCAEMGYSYQKTDSSVTVKGSLKAGNYRVAGNISSQFISGLLFALPLLDEDSTLTITPPIESRSYIGLTLDTLASFGVTASWQDDHTLFIPGRQHYSPATLTVEGDYSGAVFFEALAALGNPVTITGLSEDSLQGDRAYLRYIPMLCRGTPTIHIGDCPDLGPMLFALSAAKNGAVFTGTARLRLKESDRASAMAEELSKFGTTVTVNEDSVVIYPSDFHAPTLPLSGHGDHRIVMATAILSTLTGGTIYGAEASSKSFPDFFEKLASLGIALRTEA